jgi:hypothetical protein
MKKRDVLVIVAIVFFIVSPSLAFYVVPSMKRLPADLEQEVLYEGHLGMLDTETYELAYRDIEITRHVQSLREEDGALIIREDTTGVEKYSGEPIEELAGTYIFAVDPYTSRNIEGLGDLSRLGQWIFPMGVEKKNYLVWNQDLDDAVISGYITQEEGAAVGHYLGEEKRGGVTTYKFSGGQENMFIGYYPDLPEAEMYYSGELFAWVDPTTGAIVDLQKHVSTYIQFPDLHRLPSNTNTSAFLVGEMTMLNTSSAEFEQFNVSICNNVAVESVHDDYFMVRTIVTAEDENGRRVEDLCSSEVDALNPDTMEYVAWLSEKTGRLTFPVGVEKRDYWLWDGNANDAVRTRYVDEDEIADLQVYVYEAEINDQFLYSEPIPGFSDRQADAYYSGTTTYYVEPATGSLAYVEKTGEVTAMFPDLHSIPEDTRGVLHLEGELSLISQPKQDIRMERAVAVENVYWEDDNKVLVIEDDTAVYDKVTGEVVDLATGIEYHGVYADTAMEAPNYGDMERSGLFTFPVGVEKRTYQMWNTEIGAPSPVAFVREEDHNGVHTYLFQTEESRMIQYDALGFPMPVRYVTDTKYWVEPNTGSVIDMTKESIMQLNPLAFVTGIEGLFWINIMELKLWFTEETQDDAAAAALDSMRAITTLSGNEVCALNISLASADIGESVRDAAATKKQVAALSGNYVKAVDLTYWMTEQSVDRTAAMVQETTFLLLFMQIIIPAFLIVVGLILLAVWTRR